MYLGLIVHVFAVVVEDVHQLIAVGIDERGERLEQRVDDVVDESQLHTHTHTHARTHVNRPHALYRLYQIFGQMLKYGER